MKLKADTDVGKVIKKLAAYGDKVQDEVVDLMNESVLNIERKAKRNVKRNGDDTGTLATSIVNEPVKNEDSPQAYVIVNARYGPYVEFGTKSKVVIPAGLEGYASQFRGSTGNFDDLLKNIKAWCNRKGIEEDAAFPIALNIARNGVAPQPFLFPAYFSEVPEIEKGLIRILKKVK